MCVLERNQTTTKQHIDQPREKKAEEEREL
jgi:hypothetical protein